MRKAVLVGAGLAVLVAGCGPSNQSAAKSKMKQACRDSADRLGNPAATTVARAAARLDPRWRDAAADFKRAQQAVTAGSVNDPNVIGPIVSRLEQDCSGLGVTLGRPLGGG